MMYSLCCISNKKFREVFLDSYVSLLKRLSKDAPNKIVSRSYIDMADLLMDTVDECSNETHCVAHRLCASLLSTMESAVEGRLSMTPSGVYFHIADGVSAVIDHISGADDRYDSAHVAPDGWATYYYEVDESLLA